uniref:Putative secreted protein n=1 Tax=Ixodes ricinus TaxID=34613 RepID=V5HF89_IXORI
MKTLSIFFSFITLITGLDSGNSSSRGLLVHPRLLEERGSDGSRVLKINEDITLNLKKKFSLGGGIFVKKVTSAMWKSTPTWTVPTWRKTSSNDADAMASLYTIQQRRNLQSGRCYWGPKLRIIASA